MNRRFDRLNNRPKIYKDFWQRRNNEQPAVINI